MKKTISIIAAVTVLATTYAQIHTQNTVAMNYTIKRLTGKTGHTNDISTAAVRNFYAQFGDDKNESWYATGYGFRAKYTQDEVYFMADYDKKGHWLKTYKTYFEKNLPKDIRQRVKQVYYDEQISLVQQIDDATNSIYRVTIEDKDRRMVICVNGEEMETVEEYEK